MRQEKEVIGQVLSAAIRDENVRAVVQTNLLPGRKYVRSCEFYFIVHNNSEPEERRISGEITETESSRVKEQSQPDPKTSLLWAA